MDLSRGLGDVYKRQLLDIRHKISVAYSHQENGIVERWNHEVVRYLRAMVFDSNSVDNWSELLPFAQRICNAEVCESIGVAPAQIIFGSAINLDRSVLTPNTESVPHMAEEHPEMSEYVSQLIEKQQLAIEYARRIQKEKDDQHMLSTGEDVTEFPIGSYVTSSYPANHAGIGKPPAKLLTKRKGPFVILSYDGPIYELKNAGDKKINYAHVSTLERFHYDISRVDPMAIAAKDHREFVVERILEHRPQHYKPKSSTKHLEFLVKWKDYDDADNSWVKWHDLTNNSICHRYCMSQPSLRGLISAAYRALLEEEDGYESED
jgi:hypothetical protein